MRVFGGPIDARLQLQLKERSEVDSFAFVLSDVAYFQVDAIVSYLLGRTMATY